MPEILDTALIEIEDVDRTDLVKNSTFGLDSGLSSAVDLSSHGSSSLNGAGLHLSAFSSIDGLAPPVGQFFFNDFIQ